jgi:putative methionine-R-sulfoxide reductase with GAF domain
MEADQEFGRERRRCLRQMVHAPAFASFDGATGGMILDLSEEGLAMQTGGNGTPIAHPPMEERRRVRLEVELSDPAVHMETTGYIAWADALGRAGVKFSDLPEDARRRLNDWLTMHAGEPSRMAPKIAVGREWGWGGRTMRGRDDTGRMAISLEAGREMSGEGGNGNGAAASATVQYEFNAPGSDLSAALQMIAQRARIITRGSSAAIALLHGGSVVCRASVGESAPAFGARLDVNSGLSGECFREGKTLRCDDAENDPRVELEACRRLKVRSILAAPVRYERDTIGLLMIFAPEPFNFDEGDVGVAESLAHTVIRTIRQAETAWQTKF